MRGVDDGWLSVQEAADCCGMAYRTMLGMVRRGEVPATRDMNDSGRPYRVRRRDLEAFIERSRVRSGDLAHLHPPRIPGSRKADSWRPRPLKLGRGHSAAVLKRP
jgi:excisionase family DNA binding protein